MHFSPVFFDEMLARFRKISYLCTRKLRGGANIYKHGAIAQLVEQRTENPCVPGSIPGGTTRTKVKSLKINDFSFALIRFVRNLSENLA